MAEAHPVGFRWVMKAKENGATIIHIDPRFSRTSALADTFVPLRAGSDIAFLGAVVMAWVLAGLVGHLGPGQVTIRNGVISGLFCWLGFVVTTMLVNNSFAMRKGMLLVIDAGYWLVVLALMGAIIGAIGV